MSRSAYALGWFASLAMIAWMAVEGGRAQTQDIAPVNSGANPYRVIRDWAQLTQEQRPWGGSNGVAIDRDGKTVWATDRCSPGTSPGCLGTKANPIHHFDESGKELKRFDVGKLEEHENIQIGRLPYWQDEDGLPCFPDPLEARFQIRKIFPRQLSLSQQLQDKPAR